MNDRSDEETDNLQYADRRGFYKVEKWSKDAPAHACARRVATARNVSVKAEDEVGHQATPPPSARSL
jgi:hypothetical protein